MSTYQMCILLLFNEADRLSYGDIRDATQIAPAELKRNLQSLACVKVRLSWATANNPDDIQCPVSSHNEVTSLKGLSFACMYSSTAAAACCETHATQVRPSTS